MANLSLLADPALPETVEARLGEVLAAQSPRRSPPPTPWASTAIHGAVIGLWAVLLAAPFGLHGVWVWGGGGGGSAGLVYVTYDTLLLVFTFWQTLPLVSRARPAVAGADRVSLAVIVAARDEALVLPVTLEALLAQTDPPDRILIADDGSTDATPEVLACLYGLTAPALGGMATGHPRIHWLRLGGGGKARAMNAALSRIDEDVVLTVDADTLLQPDAVAAVRRAFAVEAKLVATTGGAESGMCANRLWTGVRVVPDL